MRCRTPRLCNCKPGWPAQYTVSPDPRLSKLVSLLWVHLVSVMGVDLPCDSTNGYGLTIMMTNKWNRASPQGRAPLASWLRRHCAGQCVVHFHSATFLATCQPATGASAPQLLSRVNLDKSLQCDYLARESWGAAGMTSPGSVLAPLCRCGHKTVSSRVHPPGTNPASCF